MRLSALQKAILTRTVLARETPVHRERFAQHYKKKQSALTKDEQNAITISIERLVDRGLLVGYGRRTAEKWFIDAVRLTPRGKHAARKLFGTQAKLPLRAAKKTSLANGRAKRIKS